MRDESSAAFVAEYRWPLDLENYTLTRDAATLRPGDVVLYVGVRRRRWIKESEKHGLLRVTRVDGQNVYGVDVYPRDGWEPDDEFVIVDGQVEGCGVYVIRSAA